MRRASPLETISCAAQTAPTPAFCEQVRRGPGDEGGQALVDRGDLVGQMLDSPGDPPQDIGDAVRTGSQPRRPLGESSFRQRRQLVAE
jgi:hypothetical protein